MEIHPRDLLVLHLIDNTPPFLSILDFVTEESEDQMCAWRGQDLGKHTLTQNTKQKKQIRFYLSKYGWPVIILVKLSSTSRTIDD